MTRTATARATAPRAARPAPAPRRAPARPPLAVVAPAPWRPKRAPFVLLSLVVVALGLLGLLVLNTVLAEDAFRRHELERESAHLREREQELARDVAALEAPERLAARAAELGLVPAGAPAFLRLSDGAVLGAVTPAAAPTPPAAPPPTPGPTPSPVATARP